MKRFLEKIIIGFNSINKVKKRILAWYIISFSIVFLEYIINYNLDFHVYFHPIISIFVEMLLLINLFFLPSSLIIIDVLKQRKSIIKKTLQIVISAVKIGLIGLTTVIIVFWFSLFNKAVFNIYTDTEKIQFSDDKIYVEYIVWLETNNHICVYEIENVFFVRLIDEYKTY